jgi:hypothetical protein
MTLIPSPPRVERLSDPHGRHLGLAGWPAWEAWARGDSELFRIADAIARHGDYTEIDRLRLIVHALTVQRHEERPAVQVESVEHGG